jgi:FkbM family methyltransferase
MNTLTIKLRSIGRTIGLHRFVYRVRAALKLNREYEADLKRVLEQTVRLGDVVWDIGANIGFYTELFCKWVGPEGGVVAFEPNPGAMATLKHRLLACPWLTLEDRALGSREEPSTLIVEGDLTSGHVWNEFEPGHPGKYLVPIQLTTGDKACGRIGKSPNVIKIDVEGFGEEVLEGFDHTLLSPALRALLVEVHFMTLRLRGQESAPIRIEKVLESKGFRLKWIDSNHLLAYRPASGTRNLYSPSGD